MYVVHIDSGRHIQAIIIKVDKQEIAFINKGKRFDFNWTKEKEYDIYKLVVDGEILGLMSLENRPIDRAIHMRLLALSFENVGKIKKYKRIAGCLIAFACRQAFDAGYGGYVYLKPKTRLETHYQQTYGLISTGLYLITERENSIKLITEYYEDTDK